MAHLVTKCGMDGIESFTISPDGRNFALAILEDVPKEWQEKIPVILDELSLVAT